MKASELITQLQKQIARNGDLDVIMDHFTHYANQPQGQNWSFTDYPRKVNRRFVGNNKTSFIRL